jgi:hypothetical protein
MPDSLTLAAEAPLRRRRTSAAVAAVAIVLAIAAAAIVVVEAAGFGERIPAGVRVDRVPVGGLTPDEASSLLRMRARMRDSRPLTLVGPLRTVATSGAALGAQAQIDQALAEASAGRVGLIRHLLGIGEARAVPLRFAFPRASIEQLAARLGATSAVDATVTVEAGRPRVRLARTGRVVDADALETRLTMLPSRLRVPSVETAPLGNHPSRPRRRRARGPPGRSATNNRGWAPGVRHHGRGSSRCASDPEGRERLRGRLRPTAARDCLAAADAAPRRATRRRRRTSACCAKRARARR